MKFCGWKNAQGLKLCQNMRWKVGATYCQDHEDEYRAKRRGTTSVPRRQATPRAATSAKVSLLNVQIPEGRTHAYMIPPELGLFWNAMMVGATKRPAGNAMFIGPSGSGKTDGAESLALEHGLDFAKIDAASMTDPESWFGTREIVVQDGVAVTDYKPSLFVESIQKPGITFIDEINRCRDEGRQILLPVIDYTRSVMNPLTGAQIRRHPQNFIIMAGNVGLQFTGISAIDPAFWTRTSVVEFEYIDPITERHIVEQASGCDPETAFILVAFATDTRERAKTDDEFPVLSTRELIAAGQKVADGLERDHAVKVELLNHTSKEGGTSSSRHELAAIWTGIRAKRLELAEASTAAEGLLVEALAPEEDDEF
jgi:MoxR-like ATPase